MLGRQRDELAQRGLPHGKATQFERSSHISPAFLSPLRTTRPLSVRSHRGTHMLGFLRLHSSTSSVGGCQSSRRSPQETTREVARVISLQPGRDAVDDDQLEALTLLDESGPPIRQIKDDVRQRRADLLRIEYHDICGEARAQKTSIGKTPGQRRIPRQHFDGLGQSELFAFTHPVRQQEGGNVRIENLRHVRSRIRSSDDRVRPPEGGKSTLGIEVPERLTKTLLEFRSDGAIDHHLDRGDPFEAAQLGDRQRSVSASLPTR